MLANERQLQLLKIIHERGTARVSELSEAFGVSAETIRQDLNKLERDGKAVRVHGGACVAPDDQAEEPYARREIMNVPDKKRIAREAVKHIEPYEQILLDASSTCGFVARELPDMPLTVLTNSFRVVAELAAKNSVEVVLLGGTMLRQSLSFYGQATQTMLSMYRVSKAFISCKGVKIGHGVSDANEPAAITKQQMIRIADAIWLLADHSKFGRSSFIRIAGLEEVAHIITDPGISPEQMAALGGHAGKVIVAK
jgi:DeoR/GlpR family transcriptional regulator of sugar metabolism